jgi:hypothetical protein
MQSLIYYTGQASLSESDNLAMKDLGYLLFRNASARFEQTDLDDRRI